MYLYIRLSYIDIAERPREHNRSQQVRHMEKQNWLLIVLAIGLVATSVILAMTQTETPGANPQKDTLSVAGQGMVTTKPDQAELYIQIESKGKTAYEAQTRNRED